MPDAPIPLVLILGPTASGKSTLAVELARRCGAELVSADAMAVYRGMDIGTAKPSADERAVIPHHCIDRIEPETGCDVAQWLSMAEDAVADIHARGKLPVVAGGTPLYAKALLEGLSAGPPRDEGVRARLQERYAREGGETLLAELERVDPDYASERHPNDQRRIVRALEVWELSRRPYSSFHVTDGRPRDDYRPLLIGLRWDKELLHRRINARTNAMFAAGLVDEVAALRPRLGSAAAQAVGYKEVLGYLQGAYDLDHARYLVQRQSRRLAKQQMTWYRRFRSIHWLPGGAEDLADRAEALLREFFAA